MSDRLRSFAGSVARYRVIVVLAVAISLTSAGTAAAVSYVVLGGYNSASTTTTVQTSANATVFSIRNTNSAGGTEARGLSITVPAGRAPIVVNPGASKALNLSADKLDGLDSSAFLPVNGTAANSSQLDGLDSNQFVHGTGFRMNSLRFYVDINSGVGPGQSFFGAGLLYQCRGSSSTTDSLELSNSISNTFIDYWIDDGSSNPTYGVVGAGNTATFPLTKAGDRVTLYLGQGGSHVGQIEVVSINTSSNCLVQMYVTERS
jgi:hypothetical protein